MQPNRAVSRHVRASLVLTLAASAAACRVDPGGSRDPLDAGDASNPVDLDASCNKGPFEKETGPIVCAPLACDRAGSFPLDSLGYGLTDSGFNLDGLNNSASTVGPTVAGCGQLDAANGVDHGLNQAGAALAPLIDLGGALARLVAPLPGEAAAPDRAVFVELFDLATLPADPCVGARLLVRPPIEPLVSVELTGSSIGDVVELSTDAPMVVPVPIPRPDGACGAPPCGPASLPITVRGLHLRLLLSPDHARILPGSSLGGYLFVGDCTGGTAGNDGLCTGGPYADANTTGLTASLTALADGLQVDPTAAQMTLEVLRGASDLHMEPTGSLSPCSGASNASVNANAVSFVLGIGGSR